MPAFARRWWQQAQLAPVDTRVYWAAMVGAVLLGVFLRLNGYLNQQLSLWLDEALWAPRFVNWPLMSLGIRPIGFVWVTRTLVGVFGATEVWFRFLPNIGALAALGLMPYVASRLLQSRALRVLLVLLFAIHPALVDFANEFKPYSFEVLVHLVPIALYLRFEQTGRRSYLLGLLAYLPISFLFAYNMAFAFPGLLLLGLRAAWQSGERRKLVAATLLSGMLCAGVAGGVYKLALTRVTSEKRTENYWGKKYDVFYRKNDDQARVDWMLGKYGDMSALIGSRRDLWHEYGGMPERLAIELGAVDRWLWIAFDVVGLLALWRARERRPWLLLLLAPVLVLALANAAGKWPFGAFRTNMFLSVYLFPIPLIGLERLAGQSVLRLRSLLGAVLATCLAPGFLFGFDWHGHKRTWTRDHYGREIIEQLYDLRREQLREHPDAPRVRLVLDLHTYETQRYYLDTHPTFSAKYRRFFSANFKVDEVGSNSLVSKVQQRLRAGEPVWVVASKESASDALGEFAENKARILKRIRVHDEHLILLVGKD